MKKPLVRKQGPQLALAEMDPKAFEKSPLTRGFFLDTRYSGEETERQPGCLILRPDESRWTMTLKDATSMQQLFVGAPTLADCWKLVEALLGDDQSPWTLDKWAAERAAEGRKKRR